MISTMLCLILLGLSNIYAQGIPNGRYAPTDCAMAATVVQAFIINGDNFTIVMPMTGQATTGKYKYSNGTLTIIEGDKQGSLACSYNEANKTIVYAGYLNCAKTSSKSEYNGTEELKIAQENFQKYMAGCKETQPLPPQPPATKKGQLIFLTHGLNDNGTCFSETVISLLGYDNYHHYGKVSANYVSPNENKAQYINQLTDEGKNVLVRLEFSIGNLSFANQFDEMKKMITIFDGHNADVVFVGHSMGGLASINYGIEYAQTHKNKKIKIITVNTPYHPNNWASFAWANHHSNNIIAGIIEAFANQNVGEAHRDLGGLGNALNNLKTKWNNFSHSIDGNRIKRYAICVSMYAKWDINNTANTEEHWSDKGDGVVDIPSQEGIGWDNVTQTKIIFGFGKGHITPMGDLQDITNPYHHINTPKLDIVIEQIKKIIEQ